MTLTETLPPPLAAFLWTVAEQCEDYRAAHAQRPRVLLLDATRAKLLAAYASESRTGQPLLVTGIYRQLLCFDGEELEVVTVRQADRCEVFG